MNALAEFKQQYQKHKLGNMEFPVEILKKYNICACLKSTENKQVYLIQSKTDNLKYILKCISSKSVENLEEEYKLHNAFTHTGLVPATEFIKEEGYSYFIRDYVEGITITEMVDMTKEGHLPDREVIDITLQLCSILDYLHTQKPPIIHRDIKPDNIIYTKQGVCKLIDFGISRRFSNEHEKDTVIMGTEYSAPPEQYGFKQTDARSDIYSIGVLMLYMMTGSLDIREIEEYPLSPKLKRIIQKCTEFSPVDRYETVKQLEGKLRTDCLYHKKNVVIGIIAGIASISLLIGASQYILSNHRYFDLQTKSEVENIEKENIIKQQTMNAQPDKREQQEWMPPIETKNNNDTKSNMDAETSDNDEIQSTQRLEDTVYTFSSGLIEAAVRKELGKAENDPILQSDLYNIQGLYICGKQIYSDWKEHFVYGKSQYMNMPDYNNTGLFNENGEITSLEDLKYMKNIHTLALYNQNISDLSPLKELTNLTCLGLGANNINSVSEIAGLERLKILDLSGNPITNNALKQINTLTSLESLDLGDTAISDLSILKEMNLKSLSIFNLKLMDCDGLEELTSLERLITTGVNNSITETGLSKIVKLSKLRELRIMGGDFSDLSVLKELTSLTYLDLCACHIDSLEGLVGMNLTTLFFDNTQVKDLEVLKNFKDLTTIGIRDIPCMDFTPFLSLPLLKYISCSLQQKEFLNQQLGETEYEIWVS
jgi:serine/threonine protein kinase/Leucine-rich repeat (LRR) protein